MLVNAAESLNFVLGLPQLDLSLGLGQSLQGVVLLLVLLVNAHTEVLSLSHQVLVLGEESGAVPGLAVPEPLGVLQLGGQGDLVLLESSNGVLSLLNLAGEVLGLHLQLLLGAVGLIEGAGELIELLVGLDNHSLGHLDVLLHVGAVPHALLQARPGLSEVSLHTSLVLLRLGLVLVDGVDLLPELSHAVVVLLSQSSKGALVTDVGLLQVRLQLGKLTLSLLVELNLEGGVGSGLLQPGADVLQVAGQEATVLLSLAAVTALHVDLLVQLVHTDLQLLHLLAVLGAQGLLVLNLGSDAGDLLLSALDGLAQLRDGPLQVGHGLLGQLEVSLNLPLHLLSVALGLLLPLRSVLALVKGLLQLALHLAQVVAPVLHGLDVLLSLLPALSGGLLVLAELGDEILLVGDLVAQSPDLTVLGALVVLALLDGGLQLLDLLPQTGGVAGHLGAGLLDTVDGVVLSLDTGVGLVHLLLQVVPGVLNAGGFVDEVLDSGATGLESQDQLVLLSGELGVDISHGGALGHGLVDVGLGHGDLVLVLLLVLSKLGALQVGLDGQPDLHPQPGLGDHVGLDGALAGVEGQLLVLQLLELHPGGLASGSGLEPGQDRTDSVLTDLLHLTELSSTEEDLGVTKTELLLVHLDNVHHGSGGGLVVLGLGHSSGSQDVVASLELGVQHLVGETLPADGDTGQHTVTLVLVHHQLGLNTSGLLVSVGHNTTDEVRLGLVEGRHQVIQLALEVGGDSLAAALLLPVLVLGGLQGLTGVVSEALDGHGVAAVLDHLDDGVVERILVLLQPAGQVVGHDGGVVDDSKMCVGVRSGVGLGEVGPLAQQVGVELLAEGLVSGLGEERLLLKDGEETHGLLKHEDAGPQVHTEVNIGPVQTLIDVLLLLEGEHVGVEELLELLVDVVDTDLLEAVVVENLEASDIEDTNVLDFLHGGVDESLVTFLHNNPEGSLVDGTSDTGHRVGSVLTGGALAHPLGTDLQLGLTEVSDHPLAVNAEKLSNLLGGHIVLDLSLLLLAHGHEVLGHVAHVHHAGGVLVHVVLLFLAEAESHEGLVSELHVLLVVNGGDGKLALGDVPVVQDVVGQQALLLQVGDSVGHDVVEGVVATLQGLLVSQTRLLQEVDDHVSSGQFARGVEMDTDELSESGGVVVPHSLGVTPGLQHRVGGNDLLLKGGLSP